MLEYNLLGLWQILEVVSSQHNAYLLLLMYCLLLICVAWVLFCCDWSKDGSISNFKTF